MLIACCAVPEYISMVAVSPPVYLAWKWWHEARLRDPATMVLAAVTWRRMSATPRRGRRRRRVG